MSTYEPSQQQAEQALAEAAERAAQLRRADRSLAVVLLVVAALYVLVGVILALFGPGLAGALALGAVMVTGVTTVAVLLARRRASSRIGSRMYTNGIVAFLLWNAAVVGASIGFDWWAPHAPGWHFTVSAVVAALPLFIVAGMLSQRSR